MADKSFKPEVAVANILSENVESNSENYEVVRKNTSSGSSNKSTRNSKAIRRMRVSYVSTRHYNRRTCMTTRYTRSASLCLKGRWLEEAGFTTGLSVDVRVMPGCLVVTALPEETAMMQALTRTHGALAGHALPVMGEVTAGGAYWVTGMLRLIRVTDVSMTKE